MSTRGTWEPLRDLMQVQKRMNQLFETALARTDIETAAGLDAWTPVADIYETPDRLVLCLELPGFEQEEIELRVDGDELIVQGERRMEGEGGGRFHRVERAYGKFVRRFNLPSRFNRDGVEATYRDGALRVTLAARDGRGPDSFTIDIR